MKRRAAIRAKEQDKPVPVLDDIDFLLGVHNLSRIGALRFKKDPDSDFLDNDPVSPAPPRASVRDRESLRNYGLILTEESWRLSPAFDINSSIDKDGLALNIDMNNNALDLKLAKSARIYFRLGENEMDHIIDELKSSVTGWTKIATKIGIPRGDQKLMESAFKI